MHVVRAAEVEDLGLGRNRVGDHRHAALAGHKVSCTPVDIDHLAFGAVDGYPVIDLVRLGGVEHDAGEHIAQGTLQRQADNDRHGPGRCQQALDRQLHDIGCRCNNSDEEDHRAHHILQQAPGMPGARHQQQPQHDGQRASTEQPPENFQHCGDQVVRDILGPRSRLQRAHAGTDQHPAEQ
ncbi:hypothetical protein D9M73_164500 [compost metagenome]